MKLVVFGEISLNLQPFLSTVELSHVSICSGASFGLLERRGKTWNVVGLFVFLASQQDRGIIYPAGGFISVINVL